jgi:N-methylhydantoinase B
LELPGGGGFGSASDRDPAAVADDVRDGLVSVEAAARDYGVVIDPATGEVDREATARLRKSAF